MNAYCAEDLIIELNELTDRHYEPVDMATRIYASFTDEDGKKHEGLEITGVVYDDNDGSIFIKATS